MTQFTRQTEYSPESLTELMQVSAARSFLSAETVKSIDEAMGNARGMTKEQEEYLKRMYEIVLEEYVREQEINANFEKRQKMLLDNFTNEVVDIKRKSDRRANRERENIEKKERKDADKLLGRLGSV